MQAKHGNGVQLLTRISEMLLKRMPRDEARSFIDGLEDDELADVMETLSAASLATGGTGNLLGESAAARLRRVPVAEVGSGLLMEEPVVPEPTREKRNRAARARRKAAREAAKDRKVDEMLRNIIGEPSVSA